MLKKLGLSAAMIFASVAMAQPAAMAANWNGSRGGGNYQSGERSGYQSNDRFGARNGDRDDRDFRDYRGDNQYEERMEHERFEHRAPVYRGRQGFGFTFQFGSRDHDRW